MKYLMAVLVCTMAFSHQAWADDTDVAAMQNVVYIEPMTVVAGDVVTLPVMMKNTVVAEGFQFNLKLPEGMTFVTERDGAAVQTVALSGERLSSTAFNLFSSLRNDGSLTVMAGSTTGQSATGIDGEVCRVMVKVSPAMAAGDYVLTLKNIAISDDRAMSYTTSRVACTISVVEQTAIRDINFNQADGSPVYNIQGQRLSNSQLSNNQLSNSKLSNSQIKKGIYIVNGQKVVKTH